MSLTVRTFDNVREASAALGADTGARFLGGGTLLMRAVNEGDLSISTVVRATSSDLSRIGASGSRIEIGAAVTMGQILASHELGFLHRVARSVGGPAIRNMATVGGNLFAPSPYGDFAVALLALDARVLVQSGYSPREVPVEEFLRQRDRSSSVIVTGVQFARPRTLQALRYHKVARVRPKGISVLTIAVHFNENNGRVSDVRVAYGSMAPAPMRVPRVERAIEGGRLDARGIAAAVAAATEGCSPPTDAIASGAYRSAIAPVYLRRLLLNQISSPS